MIATNETNKKIYTYYRLEKDGYYRTAVFEKDTKKVNDIVSIDGKDWIITDTNYSCNLSEKIYKEHLKYNDKHFSTEPLKIINIVEIKDINDEKEYHELIKYDNEWKLDTWYENESYIGNLINPKGIKHHISIPIAFEPIFGKDAWDFGLLIYKAEKIMTNNNI